MAIQKVKRNPYINFEFYYEDYANPGSKSINIFKEDGDLFFGNITIPCHELDNFVKALKQAKRLPNS